MSHISLYLYADREISRLFYYSKNKIGFLTKQSLNCWLFDSDKKSLVNCDEKSFWINLRKNKKVSDGLRLKVVAMTTYHRL